MDFSNENAQVYVVPNNLIFFPNPNSKILLSYTNFQASLPSSPGEGNFKKLLQNVFGVCGSGQPYCILT